MWDNAPGESFFKTSKAELINRLNSRRLSLVEIKKECFDYIEGFYNTRRIHSALDNKSSEEYEKWCLVTVHFLGAIQIIKNNFLIKSLEVYCD